VVVVDMVVHQEVADTEDHQVEEDMVDQVEAGDLKVHMADPLADLVVDLEEDMVEAEVEEEVHQDQFKPLSRLAIL